MRSEPFCHDVIIKDISYNGFAVVSKEDLELGVNQTVHAVLNDHLEETAENFNFHLYGLVAVCRNWKTECFCTDAV